MASKFKFNWGTGIAIFYISFVIAILFFVFWTTGNNRDLVTDDYYAEELVYQKTIDNKARAEDLVGDVVITSEKGKIEIRLPDGMNDKSVKGELFLYRQADKTMDTKLQFEGQKIDYSFQSERIVTGKWTVKLSWTSDGKDYYYEDNIWIK
ncbi:MAG: FixH family protein [Candidatus Kapaibacterium sp.]